MSAAKLGPTKRPSVGRAGARPPLERLVGRTASGASGAANSERCGNEHSGHKCRRRLGHTGWHQDATKAWFDAPRSGVSSRRSGNNRSKALNSPLAGGTRGRASERSLLSAALIAEVPHNWLDPILTGPTAALPHGYTYTPRHVENLLNAIRARMQKVAAEWAASDPANGAALSRDEGGRR